MSLHSHLAFSTINLCIAVCHECWQAEGGVQHKWIERNENRSLQYVHINPRRLQICKEHIWEIMYFICCTLLRHL